MLTKAYVLIEVEAGQVEAVLDALRATPGVRAADAVVGPYDIIATVELPDQRAIGHLVMNSIHGIAGLKHTITCIVIA